MLKLGYDLLQEAALYVLNTSSIEAALSIFTEVNNLLDYCAYIYIYREREREAAVCMIFVSFLNYSLVIVGRGAGGGCGKTKWRRH